MVKNPPANAGEARRAGLIPGSGRCPREGNGNPLQYFCLGNSMDRVTTQATYSPLGHKESDMSEHACTCMWLVAIFLDINPAYTAQVPSLDPDSSVQFRSVAQSCPTLCNPMNCSTPGLPAHHQLLEPTQTHVH